MVLAQLPNEILLNIFQCAPDPQTLLALSAVNTTFYSFYQSFGSTLLEDAIKQALGLNTNSSCLSGLIILYSIFVDIKRDPYCLNSRPLGYQHYLEKHPYQRMHLDLNLSILKKAHTLYHRACLIGSLLGVNLSPRVVLIRCMAKLRVGRPMIYYLNYPRAEQFVSTYFGLPSPTERDLTHDLWTPAIQALLSEGGSLEFMKEKYAEFANPGAVEDFLKGDILITILFSRDERFVRQAVDRAFAWVYETGEGAKDFEGVDYERI